MAFTRYERSIPEIIGDLFGQMGALLRKEGQLARAELSEKLNEAGLGVGLIAGGAVLAIPALVLLLDAASLALVASGLSPTISAVIVGGVALVLAAVLVVVGMSRLKVERLTPKRTLRQLRKDADLTMQRLKANGHDQQRAI
jgi:hypothetical protein